jgi:uncharacterized membrane protein
MGKRFVLYGFIGICTEIFWTGMGSLLQGDIRLTGITYVWMFPIYGMIVFSEPLQHRMEKWPLVLRGGVYTILIFLVEYMSGSLFKLVLGVCPWTYSGHLAINGIIKLDYAPVWFCFSLIIERIHKAMDKISVLLETQQ